MDQERAFPPGPLEGLVVCDLSTVLAGPYCTMLLADLGATVIKIEPPTGDPTRRYGPPYVGAPGGDFPGESAYYLSINRNKRDIALDLRDPDDLAILRRLIRRSDVVVENFRAGAFAELGFDDAALESLNPRLVHLAITGYGPSGPDADRPGFDFVIQAASGLMSITGFPDAEGGRPTKVGVAIADVAAGMLGAVSVLAALRARDVGAGASAGKGQRIDLSLLESTIAWLINQAANQLIGGVTPGRLGNRHPNITPYETFRCSDSEIAVAVGSERQWARFCEAIGAPQLAADPRFATNGDRIQHRAELVAELEPRFAGDTASAWLERLERAEVPCSSVRTLDQVFADPWIAAREMVATVAHPTAGEIKLTGVPMKLSRTPGSIRTPPPLHDQHRAEILAWLEDAEP